jgi:hypothetical protein
MPPLGRHVRDRFFRRQKEFRRQLSRVRSVLSEVGSPWLTTRFVTKDDRTKDTGYGTNAQQKGKTLARTRDSKL